MTKNLMPHEPPTLDETLAIAIAQQVGTVIACLPEAICIAPGDTTTYRKVKESLPVLKRAERAWEQLFKPVKDFYYGKWKAECAAEGEHTKPLMRYFDAWSQEVYRWEQAEKARERAEELRLAAERRREEQERLLAEAAHLEAAGQAAIAEQVLEQAVADLPAVAPIVTMPSAVVPVNDMSSREHWTWHYAGAGRDGRWKDLTDEQRRRIVRQLPAEYLMASETAITQQVNATKSATTIAGIVVYDKGSTTVRR